MIFDLVVLGIVAVGVATRLVPGLRSDAGRTRRVLRRTRVTRIADLVDGQLACVVGRVEVGEHTLRSIGSFYECVAYDTRIFGPPRIGMVAIETKRMMVPFFVSDASGRVRVDAPEAALSHPPIVRTDTYEERVIVAGMTVRLVGSVVRDPAVAATSELGFRDHATTATLTGTAKYPLLVDVER